MAAAPDSVSQSVKVRSPGWMTRSASMSACQLWPACQRFLASATSGLIAAASASVSCSYRIGMPVALLMAAAASTGVGWRDHGFQVVTGSHDVKAAHLRRDPRASIVVCEPAPPYRGVEVRCHARLATTAAGDVVRRIASRYLGAEAGAAYAESARDDLLIRLEPGDLRAWDFADEFS